MLSAPSCCLFQPPLLPTLLSSSLICPLQFPQLSLQADISLNLEMTLLIYHLYVIHTDSDVLSLFPCLSLCWLPRPIVKGGFTQVSCHSKKNQSFYLGKLTVMGECQNLPRFKFYVVRLFMLEGFHLGNKVTNPFMQYWKWGVAGLNRTCFSLKICRDSEGHQLLIPGYQ